MTIETFSPNDIALTMTDKAVQHFKRHLESMDDTGVRLSVKTSGCYQYYMVLKLTT